MGTVLITARIRIGGLRVKFHFGLSLFLLGFLVIFIANPLNTESASVLNDANEQQIVEVRQKFFGEENVDAETGEIRKDKVILSWFGVSNFAMAINGHVLLLDTWIPGGDESSYVPATTDELAKLQPEAIFIGHAHFDHSDNAAEIMEKTGAVLVGTPEHCEEIKKEAKNEEKIECINAVESKATPGTMSELSFLEGVTVTALTHVHSALKLPDFEEPSKAIFPKKDSKSNAPKGSVKKILGSVGEDEGGTMMYQFQVDDFTLTWNDSAGPIKEEAPDLIEILASLPHTDVQVGAIMGFNQYTNGLRDPRQYIEALKPTLFVPTHHDNWSPPITTTGANYRDYLVKELELLPEEERPELLFITDPQDYVNPKVLTFDINDRKWQ